MRLATIARQVAGGYAASGRTSATVIAGSVGRGRADAFSDVEIDVYWNRSPSDDERRASVERCGGVVTTLWPHEPDEGEWSEDFTVDASRCQPRLSVRARAGRLRWRPRWPCWRRPAAPC